MIAPRFHALARDDPDPLGAVDLGPARADHLARARRGQNGKFEAPGGNRVALTQLGHKAADLLIGQRRMVRRPAHLGLFRQQFVEMAAPARWVFTVAVAARRCPVEDRLDPAAHPARGFGLLRPNRLNRPHDETDINNLHRELAEYRVDVTVEG